MPVKLYASKCLRGKVFLHHNHIGKNEVPVCPECAGEIDPAKKDCKYIKFYDAVARVLDSDCEDIFLMFSQIRKIRQYWEEEGE